MSRLLEVFASDHDLFIYPLLKKKYAVWLISNLKEININFASSSEVVSKHRGTFLLEMSDFPLSLAINYLPQVGKKLYTFTKCILLCTVLKYH